MTFVCLIKTWKVCLIYYSEETNEKKHLCPSADEEIIFLRCLRVNCILSLVYTVLFCLYQY